MNQPSTSRQVNTNDRSSFNLLVRPWQQPLPKPLLSRAVTNTKVLFQSPRNHGSQPKTIFLMRHDYPEYAYHHFLNEPADRMELYRGATLRGWIHYGRLFKVVGHDDSTGLFQVAETTTEIVIKRLIRKRMKTAARTEGGSNDDCNNKSNNLSANSLMHNNSSNNFNSNGYSNDLDGSTSGLDYHPPPTMMDENLTNPYHDIAVMERFGDGSHLLPCLEALEDDKYLYIVSRRYTSDMIMEHRRTIPDDLAQSICRILLEDLRYMQQHRLCHFDLSPENILMNDTLPLQMVLFDFEEGFRRIDDTTVPCPKYRFSKFPYAAPEIYHNYTCHMAKMDYNPYIDPYAADVWSLGATLFTILTQYFLPNDSGRFVPGQPWSSYLCHRILLEKEALVDDEILHQYLSKLESMRQHHRLYGEYRDLYQKLRVLSTMNPALRSLLRQMLQVDPEDRWTVDELLEHPYLC